ncbi:MAG: energy transducer TonB [Hyphomonadaceae bacterium]|nr:energy transducer TonB [Hyphomonadaceae bacterium]
MRTISTVVALLVLTACDSMAPGPGAEAMRSCRAATQSSQHCSCAKGILSEDHFALYGRALASQDPNQTTEQNQAAMQYSLAEGTNGDPGEIVAFGLGMEMVQRQCPAGGSRNTAEAPQTTAQPPPVVPSSQRAASTSAPSGNPQQQVLARLAQARAELTPQGFQAVGQTFSGGLAQGQTENVPIELSAGFDYRVIGICDDDCTDLDLALHDQGGTLVTQDTAPNGRPIVGVIPHRDGRFTIQVQMPTCSAAPCYYAVALYGRPIRTSAQAPATSQTAGSSGIYVRGQRWTARPTPADFARHYPPEALQAGVGARVALDCAIDATGGIDCIVDRVEAQQQSEEFATATLRMTRYFRMAPELVDGTPTAGRRHRFNIRWEPPER